MERTVFFLNSLSNKVALAGGLMLFLVGCTDGVPEFTDLGSGVIVQSPTFSQSATKTIEVSSATEAVSVSGECDVRIDELSLSKDSGVTWVVASTAVDSDSDLNCKDGQFVVELDDISSLVSLVSVGDRQTVLFRGTTKIGETDVAQLEFHLVAPNNAPTLAGTCAGGMVEDTAYGDCALTANDVDGDPITYALDTSHTCAFLSVNPSTGAVTGTPDNSDVGTVCTVAIKVTDGRGGESAPISNTVTVTNAAPAFSMANPSPISEDGGEQVLLNGAAVQASDEGQSDNGYSIVAASSNDCSGQGTVALNATSGELKYTPNLNYNGTCKIKVSFDDSNSGVVEDEIDVVVSPVNDAPTISATTCTTTTVNQDTLVTCTATFADVDGDSPIWELDTVTGSPCSWMSLDSSTANPTVTISGTPDDDDVGTCDLRFRVRDSAGTPLYSAYEDFDITVTNVAPTLNIANVTISEDAVLAVIANDAAVNAGANEEGHGLYTFDHASTSGTKCNDKKGAGGLSIDGNTGAISFQPEADFDASCNIKVQFDDGNGGVVADSFTVNITAANDAPVISSTCDTSVDQDSAYSCTPSVIDPDLGDTQTWAATTNTCSDWLSIDAGTGVLSGAPDDDDVGDCTVTFRSNDGAVDSNPQTYTITVDNLQPTLTIVNAAAILEDAGATVIRTDAEVAANEEGMGTYSLITPVGGGDFCEDHDESLTIDPNTGEITFEPADHYNGTCRVAVRFDDGEGEANSTVNAEFTIGVTPQNDAPVITATCASTATEGTLYSCDLTFTDEDGDLVTWSAVTPDHDCNWLGFVGSTPRRLRGTPGNGDVGTCTIKVEADDGNGGTDIYEVATVTVSNLLPTLTIADAADISEEAPSTVIRNDAAVQASQEGDGTYSIIAASSDDCNAHKFDAGSLSINSTNGAVTFRPAVDYYGTCNINVQFNDGHGSVSDEFAITVDNINDPPELTSNCANTNFAEHDSTFSCSISAIVDPDPAEDHAYGVTGDHTCGAWLRINSSNGTVSIDNGSPPENGDVGTCTVSYVANDGEVDSNVIEFDITIDNLPPSIIDLSSAKYSVGEDNGSVVIVPAATMNSNEEGETGVSYSIVSSAAPDCNDAVNFGVPTVDSLTGEVEFDPADEKAGVNCNLSVQVTDGMSDATTTFEVYISPKPEITGATCFVQAYSGLSYTCNLAEFVTGWDDAGGSGDISTISKVNTGELHECSWINDGHISGAGVLTVTPTDANVGPCLLRYQISDGFNQAEWSIYIDVRGATQSAPVSNGESSCINRNGLGNCWGRNNRRNLGVEDSSTHLAGPREVIYQLAGASEVTTIRNFSLATDSSGLNSSTCLLYGPESRVMCMGSQDQGQLGNNIDSSGTQFLAHFVKQGEAVSGAGGGYLHNVVQLAGGLDRFHCALDAFGKVLCWGNGSDRALGNGSSTDNATPVYVRSAAATPLENVIQVVTGDGFGCALLANRRVRCWGNNSDGQGGRELGLSTLNYADDDVKGFESSPVAMLSAGDGVVCALKISGDVKCWGRRSDGMVGDGVSGDDLGDDSGEMSGGDLVFFGGVKAKWVTVGWKHACIITLAGKVRCWGRGPEGQLGQDDTVSRFTLTDPALDDIQLSGQVIGLSLGSDFTCLTFGDHQTKCFGDDTAGKLGNGLDSALNFGSAGGASSIVNALPVQIRPSCGLSDTFETLHSNTMYECNAGIAISYTGAKGSCAAGSHLCSVTEYGDAQSGLNDATLSYLDYDSYPSVWSSSINGGASFFNRNPLVPVASNISDHICKAADAALGAPLTPTCTHVTAGTSHSSYMCCLD